ncbi:MAG: 1-acyl-sn-glycerol-3-phosphate acyltransferase [Acidobacteria bacterium]|nr:1-acyl-sn-glycerol-3-phosphate acyltransferase [Acidobacteriota bacterium]
MIRTIFVVGLTFVYIFIFGPPALLISFVSGSARVLYIVGRAGAKMAFFLGGMSLEVYGHRELPVPARARVYVPNHESIIDPVVVFLNIPEDIAALGKKEFFRLPILGRACRMAGFVVVDRQNPEQRVKAREKAIRLMKEKGRSFLVFAEGTRSTDGRLRPFKKGAAIMAIEAQAEIVPIAVHGGFALWPKGRWYFRPGPVQVRFLDPISTDGMTLDDKDRLTEECRSRIAACLARIDTGRSTGSP